jgi:hypothetical protein
MSANDGNWVRAIRGPITLITVGALFALNNFNPAYTFDRTWPVLLIVFGLLSLLRRSVMPPPAPPAPPQFPPPNYNYPPPPPAAGSYSSSPYAQPAPSKGGFGTTAPPRAPEAGQNPASQNPTAQNPQPGDTI